MREESFPKEDNSSSARGGVGEGVNLVNWSMTFVDRDVSQRRKFKEQLGAAMKEVHADQLFQSRILMKSLKIILCYRK